MGGLTVHYLSTLAQASNSSPAIYQSARNDGHTNEAQRGEFFKPQSPRFFPDKRLYQTVTIAVRSVKVGPAPTPGHCMNTTTDASALTLAAQHQLEIEGKQRFGFGAN